MYVYVLHTAMVRDGYWLARQPLVVQGFTRYGQILVPFVFVCLGIYILVESRSYTLLPFLAREAR